VAVRGPRGQWFMPEVLTDWAKDLIGDYPGEFRVYTVQRIGASYETVTDVANKFGLRDGELNEFNQLEGWHDGTKVLVPIDYGMNYKTLMSQTSRMKRGTILPILQKKCVVHNVDFEFIKALIEIESHFNQFAIGYKLRRNKKGKLIFRRDKNNKKIITAYGLGQISPGVANIYEVPLKNMFVVDVNLDLTIRYVKEIAKGMGVDVRPGKITLDHAELIAIAYNAGPSIAKKYGLNPPYTETKRQAEKMRRLFAKAQR